MISEKVEIKIQRNQLENLLTYVKDNLYPFSENLDKIFSYNTSKCGWICEWNYWKFFAQFTEFR